MALKTAHGSTANGKTAHIIEIDKNKEKDIKENRSTSCVATRKRTKQNQDPCKPMLAGESQKQTQPPIKPIGERKAKSESQNLDTATASFFEELNKSTVNQLWIEFVQNTKASYYWKNKQQAELLRRFNAGESIEEVLGSAMLYNFRDLRILEAINLPNNKFPASSVTRNLLRARVSL